MVQGTRAFDEFAYEFPDYRPVNENYHYLDSVAENYTAILKDIAEGIEKGMILGKNVKCASVEDSDLVKGLLDFSKEIEGVSPEDFKSKYESEGGEDE